MQSIYDRASMSQNHWLWLAKHRLQQIMKKQGSGVGFGYHDNIRCKLINNACMAVSLQVIRLEDWIHRSSPSTCWPAWNPSAEVSTVWYVASDVSRAAATSSHLDNITQTHHTAKLTLPQRKFSEENTGKTCIRQGSAVADKPTQRFASQWWIKNRKNHNKKICRGAPNWSTDLSRQWAEIRHIVRTCGGGIGA